MSYDLFLLAHPDDELFVYPMLQRATAPAVIAYLTSGGGAKLAKPETRKGEAARSVAAAGAHDIAWVGIACDIDVYALHHRLSCAWRSVDALVSARGAPRRIVTHAWEGGHSDHDAAHLLAQDWAGRLGISASSMCFPFYRAAVRAPLPFVVMSPLRANGEAQSLAITGVECVSMLRSMAFHSSQIKALLGLSPGVLLNAILPRRLYFQSMADSCAPRRPMQTSLLYERRSKLAFEQFLGAATASLTEATGGVQS